MSQVRKDVLNGWKEIAAYLGRDPRTVERWEKHRSLPVRRLPGSGRATVYALVADLDAWLASSQPREVELARAAESTHALAGDPEAMPTVIAEPTERGAVPVEGLAGEEMPSVGRGREVVSKPAHQNVGQLLRAGPGPLMGLLLGIVMLGIGLWWMFIFVRTRAGAGLRGEARPHTLVPQSRVAGVEQLYMRGCYQTEQRTPESLLRAQDAFREALLRDPGYAPAYAGLASTFLLLREYATMPDAVAYQEARKDAVAALTRDPDLPQAHAVMGFVDFFWDWHPEEAERQFQKALALDPQLALSHHWYGSMLTHEGRYGEGLRQLEAAQRLEPTSSAILTTRALAIGLAGRRDEATSLLEEALSAEASGQYRNPSTMHNVLASLSLQVPRNLPRYLSETLVAAELREDAHGVETMRMAADVFRREGETAMWQALLENERRRHQEGGPTYAMARFEAETGAREQALSDLTDLYSRHDPAMIGMAIDPLLVPLRSEPRYVQLRTAMGLPLTPN